MDFITWLRDQMERHHYNQPRLAEVLGVNQSTVSNWLRGKVDPTPENLVALSGLFNYDHLSLMEIAGVIGQRSPALPNGDEQQVVDKLKMLRDAPQLHRAVVQNVISQIDIVLAARDEPDQSEEEASGEEIKQQST